MMVNKVAHVTFTFENCERATVPFDAIVRFAVTNITENHHVNHKGELEVSFSAGNLFFLFTTAAMSVPIQSPNDRNSLEFYARLKQYNDVTQVALYDEHYCIIKNYSIGSGENDTNQTQKVIDRLCTWELTI